MNSKTKKHAILSLVAAMFLSLVVAFVPAFATWTATAEGTTVAIVGETEYKTFADALTAAKAQTGNVTVEIYEKVTLKDSLYGSFDSITFVGKDTDAEIYLDVQGYITATGKTVNFEDLKLSKSTGGYIGNAGFMNVAFGVYDVVAVNYTNCTFLNGAYASSGVVTFEKCTFYRSHDRYGLWSYGKVETIVNNCTFDDIRGIKMYSEDKVNVDNWSNLTITNTVFTDKVTDKPAIVLTFGQSVTLANNTYPSKGTFELDLGGKPNGTIINSTDAITCVNDNGACGVIVKNVSKAKAVGESESRIYTTLVQAAEVAESGAVVTLLHNSAETVEFKTGVELDKNGYTADSVSGATEVTAVAKIGPNNYYQDFESALKALSTLGGGTLTLMSDVLVDYYWDCRNTGAKISVPVTIDGNGHKLTFTNTVYDGGNQLSAFRFEAPATVKNLTIDMSQAISGFAGRFRAISTKADLVVDNCTFIGNGSANNTRAIIFGEGSLDAISEVEVSITNSTFNGWRRGVSDNENTQDAKTVTITDNTFTDANVYVSATDKVTFNGNTMGKDTEVNVKSYTKPESLNVEFNGNNLDDSVLTTISAIPNNITTDDASIKPIAQIGTTFYSTVEDLLAVIAKDSVITLKADVKLYQTLIVPADYTFNGNGYTVDGVISADGNLTIAGYTKVTNFGAGSGDVVTIVEGATLELTTTGRMSIGNGATFNITGTIADAKTTDVTSVKPSLIAAGASFSGTNLNFNVTNAYLKFTAYCSSKNKEANGTYNFNITNSIWEQTGSFVFSAPTEGMDPTFNLNIKDSVFNSTSHFVISATKSNVVIDNSNVNVDTKIQIENCGTMTIKNGSIVNGANASSSNAKMPGTLIVDNATYATTGEYTGSDLGIGTLIIKNGANVSLGDISKTIVYKEDTSELTLRTEEIVDDEDVENGETALDKFNRLQNYWKRGDAKLYILDTYTFSITLDKNALKANESLTATVSIDKTYYSAEYIFTYDKDMFTCAADLDDDGIIYVTNLFKGNADNLATYTLIAKNDIDKVSNSAVSVTGNVIQYVEQILNDVNSPVLGDTESIKISLNYTATIKADYVLGYSLVLVSGEDGGYAYDGKTMFYVEAYDAYAIIVKGKVTAEDIDEKLSKATGYEVIRSSYNVNAEYVNDGIVDLKDATAVYACVNNDFIVEDYMELFLRADVNGDKVVNIIDVNEVTKNYTK